MHDVQSNSISIEKKAVFSLISPFHKNMTIYLLLQAQSMTSDPMFWKPTAQLLRPICCCLWIVCMEIDFHLPGNYAVTSRFCKSTAKQFGIKYNPHRQYEHQPSMSLLEQVSSQKQKLLQLA